MRKSLAMGLAFSLIAAAFAVAGGTEEGSTSAPAETEMMSVGGGGV